MPPHLPLEKGIKMEIQTNELELSNGVKLTVGPIDATIYLEIVSQLESQSPKPPQLYVKSVKAWQPNYDHPDYQRDVEQFQLVRANRMVDFFLVDGIKDVVVPKGMKNWNSDEFAARMSILRFDLPDNEPERRFKWLKIVALKDQKDLNKVTTEIARLSGVAESDVQAAEAAFPGETGK